MAAPPGVFPGGQGTRWTRKWQSQVIVVVMLLKSSSFHFPGPCLLNKKCKVLERVVKCGKLSKKNEDNDMFLGFSFQEFLCVEIHGNPLPPPPCWGESAWYGGFCVANIRHQIVWFSWSNTRQFMAHSHPPQSNRPLTVTQC